MLRWKFVIVSSGLIAASAAAQQTRGSIAISGGRATDVAGVSSSAVTAAPSLTIASPSSSIALFGSATRFTNSAWSASAGAALSGRLTDGAVSPTVDLSGTAATTSYSFSYQLIDATPALEGRWHAGDALLRLFGGAHFGAASASRALQTTPAFGGALPSSGSSTSATSAAGLVGATLSFEGVDGQPIGLSYRAERGRVAGATQTDNTVGLTTSSQNIGLSASLGVRQSVDGQNGFGSAAVTIGMTSIVGLQIAGGRYPANRMLGVPGGDYLNLGAVIRLRAPRQSLPRPSGVPSAARGVTRLSIRAADATTVEVAGEFNHWEFVRATRAGNGVWFADLRIPAGQYRYAFRINGKEWRIPEGAVPAEDEFGGKSAWLTVDRTGRGS